jgi:hypothetical protein
MASIAETSLSFNQWDVGKIRVLRVSSEPALEPRLAFQFECNLSVPSRAQIGKVKLARIGGELRTCEGKFIAPLEIAEPFLGVSTGTGNGIGSFQAFADIDWSRFAILEATRADKSASFQFRIVYWLVADHAEAQPSWGTFVGSVPIEDWCKVLESLGQGRFEIFTMRMAPSFSDATGLATKRIQEARALLEKGEFDAAVVAGRRSLEGLAQAVDRGQLTPVLKAAISQSLGTKKGEPIGRILSGLLDLLALGAHETGAGDFVRRDAEFAIRVTASFIALVSDSLDRAKPPPAQT